MNDTPAARKTVLAIEDDHDFLPLLRMMLADERWQVAVASTGEEGLAALRQLKPDVVILDLMLPDVHGWEILRRMRADPATAGIPVIILSVMGTRQERLNSRELNGVHDYLLKPCLPSQLRQSVASALAL